MKADESKDLIERVGGLEAAQMIINDAPDGANAIVGKVYLRFTDKHLWSWHGGKHKCSSELYFYYKSRAIQLSDLRAAITEQRPHPCATCPNHGHKACCHEVA